MVFSWIQSGFEKIKKALFKSSSFLFDRMSLLFSGDPWKEEQYEQLEELFFELNFGSKLSVQLVEEVRSLLKMNPESTAEEALKLLQDSLLQKYRAIQFPPHPLPPHPTNYTVLILGINGSGKTTSCAKLAQFLKQRKETCCLVAADTFRAAAGEQLQMWAKKIDVGFYSNPATQDPAAVVFGALAEAKEKPVNYILIDTAGRLQNKTELMMQLQKMDRACKKWIEGAPHQIFLVLDATMGQNGLDQVEVFKSFLPLSGLILTKIDGSAKGGIALPILLEHKIPILFAGTGEGENDWIEFDFEQYLSSLFGVS